MRCPKCGSTMAGVEHEGVAVDRCSRCGGLWFDLLELEDLTSVEGSEAVDTGDLARARWYDAHERVHCPRDGTPMAQMVDATQPHVWLESCPVCHGVYLDAGEFTDLKELTLFERLRRRRRPRPG